MHARDIRNNDPHMGVCGRPPPPRHDPLRLRAVVGAPRSVPWVAVHTGLARCVLRNGSIHYTAVLALYEREQSRLSVFSEVLRSACVAYAWMRMNF
jgi:hypothetical protein